MTPQLALGESVTIHWKDPAILQAEDIVAIINDTADWFLVHRIYSIQCKENKFILITKGDAVGVCDMLQPIENYIGVVGTIHDPRINTSRAPRRTPRFLLGRYLFSLCKKMKWALISFVLKSNKWLIFESDSPTEELRRLYSLSRQLGTLSPV